MGIKRLNQCKDCGVHRNIQFRGNYCRPCFNTKINNRYKKIRSKEVVKKFRYLNCKECGIERTSNFLGNYCYPCFKERKKQRMMPKTMDIVVYASGNWSKSEALEWIEKTIKNNCMVDMAGINNVITAYHAIGGSDRSDGLDNYPTRVQLEVMWQKCLEFYSQMKKTVLENNI
jgi:hypothetical protein